MNRDVVLLDSQHARIFRIGTQTAPEAMRFSHPDHHTHAKDQGDSESHRFYSEVAKHLLDADELLVLGHGMAKAHFKTYLQQHHAGLAKKVVGYETVNNPTDGQLAAFAAQYFHRVEAVRAVRGE